MRRIKTIVVDPRMSGIAGDMFVASLVDLGGSEEKLYALAETIEETLDYCSKFRITVDEVRKKGIRAKNIEFLIKENCKDVSAEMLIEDMNDVKEQTGLCQEGQRYVDHVIDELIMAETKIHDLPRKSVNFHEVTSSDTVFDIIGVALLLEDLGYLDEQTEIYSTPPALGSGTIETPQGLMSVPTPASLHLLTKHKYKCSTAPVESEMVTPTGAALLVSLTEDVIEFFPPMQLQKTGYGAGKREVEGVSNVLRVVEGAAFKATNDKVVVIETNLDDVTGETIGYLVDKLLRNGAYDVTVLPALGKKNRPANIVKIMSDYKNYDELVQILIDETGTLGVRVYETPRIIAEREKRQVQVSVKGTQYPVTIKTSKTKNGELINIKPEYDDLQKIAEDTDLALRKVAHIVENQIRDLKELWPSSE